MTPMAIYNETLVSDEEKKQPNQSRVKNLIELENWKSFQEGDCYLLPKESDGNQDTSSAEAKNQICHN